MTIIFTLICEVFCHHFYLAAIYLLGALVAFHGHTPWPFWIWWDPITFPIKGSGAYSSVRFLETKTIRRSQWSFQSVRCHFRIPYPYSILPGCRTAGVCFWNVCFRNIGYRFHIRHPERRRFRPAPLSMAAASPYDASRLPPGSSMIPAGKHVIIKPTCGDRWVISEPRHVPAIV